jgi:alcohol dehydrogenase
LLNIDMVGAPLRLFQGDGCLRKLAKELDRVSSRRAVIFCGRTIASNDTLIRLIRDALQGRLIGTFDSVQAHSPLDVVKSAAIYLRACEADAVIVVGGGSAIVTSRAANIVLAEGMEVTKLSTVRDSSGTLTSPRLTSKKLPQFVIPTTPTTAVAKAGCAVFDASTEQRLAMYDPKTRAQGIFIHPEFVLSSPTHLVVAAAANTLAMAVEGLESEYGNPFSDSDLMHSLRMLQACLPRLAADPSEVSVRADLILSAILCGRGTDQSGGGICSSLAHAMGARFDVENGLVNAALLPHTVRFNSLATTSRVDKIAAALGGDCTSRGIECVIDRLQKLIRSGLTDQRLRDLGVPHYAIPEIAAAAMDDWFTERNPRKVVDARALQTLLEAAW